MKNNNEVLHLEKQFMIKSRYRYEIVNILCPWCFGMTTIVEDMDNECEVCKSKIRMEDLNEGV